MRLTDGLSYLMCIDKLPYLERITQGFNCEQIIGYILICVHIIVYKRSILIDLWQNSLHIHVYTHIIYFNITKSNVKFSTRVPVFEILEELRNEMYLPNRPFFSRSDE